MDAGQWRYIASDLFWFYSLDEKESRLDIGLIEKKQPPVCQKKQETKKPHQCCTDYGILGIFSKMLPLKCINSKPRFLMFYINLEYLHWKK